MVNAKFAEKIYLRYLFRPRKDNIGINGNKNMGGHTKDARAYSDTKNV